MDDADDDRTAACRGTGGHRCPRRQRDAGCERCATLLERHQAAALERLIVDHREAALQCARRIIGDAEPAGDVVQEAFLRLVRDGGPIDAPLCAWLHRVVRNLAIDTVRRRRRSVGGDVLAWLPAPAEDDAEAVGERRQRVRAVLAALPPPLRDLLERYEVEGIPVTELARRSGTPEGTLRWRLFVAREAFRSAWRARGADD